MNKIVKIYVGRSLDNWEKLEKIFICESECYVPYKISDKWAEFNKQELKKGVEKHGDKLEIKYNDFIEDLFIGDHNELKEYDPNNTIILTLGSYPQKSCENFSVISLEDYLEEVGIDIDYIEVEYHTFKESLIENL